MMKAYTFVPDIIPDEAFQQGTHWYDRKGKCHKIVEMDIHHIFGVMRFISSKFTKQRSSDLYNAMCSQYMRLKAEQRYNSTTKYYLDRRDRILTSS